VSIKWGKVLQIAGYGSISLVLLGVRHANLSLEEPTPVAMQASLVAQETQSDQQLEVGRNLLSDLVLVRANYLIEAAKQQPDPTVWIDEHRGRTLGTLRAADDQRLGLWKGTAEDNALASTIVESLAIEVAKTAIAEGTANLPATHGLGEYLANARLAGAGGFYDPAIMQIFLAASGLVQEQEATQ